MNAEKVVILKGGIVNKTVVLSNPKEYQNKPVLCLLLDDSGIPELKTYLKDGKIDLSKLEITLKEWPYDPTERAKHFFFMVRDRVAKAQGDEGRENKDGLYRNCVKSFKFMYKGYPKESVKDLNKRELWMVTEQMYMWAEEAGCMMKDLEVEWSELREELRNDIKRNDDLT